MCCSQGSEGRSSIGRRLAAVAAGVVATALMLGCSLAMGTVANAQEGDSPVAASQEGNGNKHFMVYYRAWRDVTMKGVNTDLPDDNWISMYDISIRHRCRQCVQLRSQWPGSGGPAVL